MRSIRLALAAVLITAGIAACSASESPGWTYVPAPSPTPTPVSSTNISPAPSLASAVPSGGPSQNPGQGGAVITLAAQNIAFSKDSLQVPAGQAFQIQFQNNDAGVPHNVAIKDANGTIVFQGAIINGVASVTYDVPALGSGNYQFVCTVHPNMVGTLVAG